MRFDNKTNKQRAKKLSIGELSGVTIPAVQGSVSTIRKYAADTGSDDFQTLVKATFTETLQNIEDSERGRELLDDTYDKLWRNQDALFTSMRNVMDDPQYGETPEQRADIAKQQVRDYAMSLLVDAGLAKQDPTKSEDGKNFPASDFAYVPDRTKPSTWKLRLTSTPGGKPDTAIVGAAAAALGPGFRGEKVQIPSDARAAVVGRVRSAWKKANPEKSDDEMPSGIKKQAEDDMSKIEELEKQLAEQTVLAGMTDAQKTHYATLKDESKEAFAKMSVAERDAAVDFAKANDETHKMCNGTVIQKSAMGDMFEVVKSQDIEIAKMKSQQDLAKFSTLAESDEYKYLPGDTLAKAQALKSVANDEAVLSMLKAGNAALKPNFEPTAKRGADVIKSAEDQLDSLAKAHAEKHSVSFAKAYDEVLHTKEGADLYNETLGA